MGSGSSKKKQKPMTAAVAVSAFSKSNDQNPVVSTPTDQAPVASQSTKEAPLASQSAATKCSATRGILLSCHSKDVEMAERISRILESRGFDTLTATEVSPSQLDDRETTVQWARIVVVMASIKYQRNQTCLELANYAKDTKKPITSIIVQPNYRPSGPLGAISIAGGNPIYFGNQEGFEQNMNSLVEVLNEKANYEQQRVLAKPEWDDGQTSGKFGDVPTDGNGVFVSYHEDGSESAGLVKNGQGTSSSLSATLGNPNKDNLAAIKACATFIAIMSPGYQGSSKCQEEFECARAGRKKIVPVKGVEGFRPSGWLALAIAGKLYYELTSYGQAYSAYPNVPDSNPMNDFVYAVCAKPHPHEDEVERAEIAALKKQLEKAKGELGDEWPPKKRPPEEEEDIPVLKPEDLVVKNEDNLPFNYIHHEVTRMSFNPPKPLFDYRGVPIKQKFDVMLSYQWDIQSFVRDVYMDLDMRSFKAWMDIWGGMLGNINSAMAAAVESSSVILSFLTDRYQQSVNCNLELKYAVSRKKPIVFVKVQPNLQLQDWIQEIVSRSVVFEMSSIKDAGKMDNGIPRINRMSEAIRKLAQWQAKRVEVTNDVSEEVFALQDQLEDALYWIHKNEGTKRFETCTRCGIKFDETSAAGCKKHRAYFMGGTIIAGRWVCCQSREKEGMGCENASHTNALREFKEIPGHGGCFKWDPE